MQELNSSNLFDIDSITSGGGGGGQGVDQNSAIHHNLGYAPLVKFWNGALLFSGGLFSALLMGNVPIFGQIKLFLYVAGAIYVMLYKNPNVTRNWQPRVALIVGGITLIEFFIYTINLI